LDPTTQDVAAVCRAATEGRGADLAVIAVASPAVVDPTLAALRPGGRALLFAQTRIGEPLTLDAGQVGVHEKRLLGSYSADIDLQPLAAELLFTRRVQVAPLVTHRFPLAEIGTALDVATRPRENSLKVMVLP
jgi:L-iditol 2-dehydrogenase